MVRLGHVARGRGAAGRKGLDILDKGRRYMGRVEDRCVCDGRKKREHEKQRLCNNNQRNLSLRADTYHDAT
jgi:hypothetical protein